MFKYCPIMSSSSWRVLPLGRRIASGLASWFVLAAVMLPAAGAFAAVDSDAVDGIETIVVTATKRSENVLDVPISMEVIGGAQIEEMRIRTFEDLEHYVPNFNVQPTPGANQIYIRGIGSGAQNFAFEQAVSLYVDGVYAGRNRQFMAPFFDVERVEVLRGPQGALVGKNTAAGALMLVSSSPEQEFEGYLDAGILLDREGVDLSGVLSGGITESLAGRLAVKYTDADGYVDDRGTGRKVPALDNTLVRGTLTYTPNDLIDITTKVEYADFVTEGTQAISEYPGSSFSDGEKTTEDPFGVPESDNTESWNASVLVDVSIGENTLTSLTAFSSFDADKFTGAASTDPQDWLSIQREDFDQISQEIRLVSPSGKTIEWFVGAYVDSSSYQTSFDTQYDLLGGFFLGHTDMAFDQDTTTWSAFGQVEWNATESLTLIGSARYTDTSKDATLDQYEISGTALPGAGVLPKYLEDSLSEGTFDPSVTARYQINPDTMVYLTWARGSKAGGFVSNSSSVSAGTFEYKPEESNNIEAGMKAAFLDGRITSTLAVFHTEFDDLQVSNYVPGDGLVIGNAASATTKGVELAGDWFVGGGLSLGLSAGYLDAKYDDFPGGPCLEGTVCPPDPVDNDIGGSTIPGTSKWTGNVHGGYESEVFDGLLFSANLVVAYRSGYYVEADLNSDSHQDSYTKVDARVALSGRDEKWQIALLGKNLTDEHTFNFSYFWPFGPAPHRLKYLEETRTVQLQLRYTM